MKKLKNILATTAVTAVVLFAALLGGSRLIGMKPFTVLSGSMEPAYHTGSLIYVKETAPEALTEGTVITFMADEDTVVTHRIVEIVPDDEDPEILRFRTKGDANDAVDGALVHENNVIGTPVFSIPYLGYVSNKISTPPGLYIAIGVCIFIVAMSILPDEKKSSKGEKEKDPEPQK